MDRELRKLVRDLMHVLASAGHVNWKRHEEACLLVDEMDHSQDAVPYLRGPVSPPLCFVCEARDRCPKVVTSGSTVCNYIGHDGPPVKIGKDGTCEDCSGYPCPLGRCGSANRCTEAELVAEGVPVTSTPEPTKWQVPAFCIGCRHEPKEGDLHCLWGKVIPTRRRCEHRKIIDR